MQRSKHENWSDDMGHENRRKDNPYTNMFFTTFWFVVFKKSVPCGITIEQTWIYGWWIHCCMALEQGNIFLLHQTIYLLINDSF